MIKLILAFTFVFQVSLSFASDTNSFLKIISDEDKVEILSTIDRVCADSWCSGDYEYQFSNFSCNDNTSTCTLTFKIIDRDSGPTEAHLRNKKCIFKGITSKEKIISGVTLNQKFYDQLNYCVTDRETRL